MQWTGGAERAGHIYADARSGDERGRGFSAHFEAGRVGQRQSGELSRISHLASRISHLAGRPGRFDTGIWTEPDSGNLTTSLRGL